VLHGTYEIAGQAMMLARALRAHGADAVAFSYGVAWEGRVSDVVVDLARAPGAAGKGATMLGSLLRHGLGYDVVHLHFGTSFLPRLLDVPVLRRLGARIAFHFHGCEIRNRDHMLRAHRLSTCTECEAFCRPGERPNQQGWLRARAARWADRIYYSTDDLRESIAGAAQLPLAIEADRWIEAGRAHAPAADPPRDGVRGPLVVGHAPTDRLIKGTRHVIAAVEALRAELPRIELRLFERRPWAEMPRALAECDVIVDQLHMGGYGLLAIEGMAVGTPVIAYLRDDVRAAKPELPVLSAEPATLAHALRALAADPAARRALGERGRTFARSVHDLRVVGARLLDDYRRLLEARR
jgi:glycosyltransferase involved in cell wall biosynthesis